MRPKIVAPLIIALALAAVLLLQYRHSTSSSPPSVKHKKIQERNVSRFTPRIFNTGNFNLASPIPASLYLANLSDNVDGYQISLREVISGKTDIYHNTPPGRRAPLGPLLISLQIMSAIHDVKRRILQFPVNLKAIDSSSHVLHEMQGMHEFEFPSGMGAVVSFRAPAPGVHILKTLEGDIQALRGGNATSAGTKFRNRPELFLPHYRHQSILSHTNPVSTLHFIIHNIPLPDYPRIFGMASSRIITQDQLPAGISQLLRNQKLEIIEGAKENLLNHLFPPYIPDPGPFHQPNRMIMPLNVRSSSLIPVGGLQSGVKLNVQIKPDILPNGEIPVDLTVRLVHFTGALPDASIHLRPNLWDHEPVALLIPYKRKYGTSPMRFLGLWIDLYLDMPPPNLNSLPQPSCPFPAHAGITGGTIKGMVCILHHPVPLGSVKMSIARAGYGRTVSLLIPLDRGGGWRITGLEPGRYNIQILGAAPYVSPISEHAPWTEYARIHNHIQHGYWDPPRQNNIIVHSGDHTKVASFNYL